MPNSNIFTRKLVENFTSEINLFRFLDKSTLDGWSEERVNALLEENLRCYAVASQSNWTVLLDTS